MEVEHPRAGDGPGTPPGAVDVNGERVPVEDGVFEVDDVNWLRRFAQRHSVEPDELVREEDGPPDEDEEQDEGDADDSLAVDPGDHSVADLRDVLDERDLDSDDLQAIRDAEVSGKDRTTALEAIDSRLDNQED